MVLDCQKEAGRCSLPLIYKAKHVAEVPQHGINGNSALLPLFLLLATMTSNTVTMQEKPNPCSPCTSPLALCTILARVTAPIKTRRGWDCLKPQPAIVCLITSILLLKRGIAFSSRPGYSSRVSLADSCPSLFKRGLPGKEPLAHL